MTAQAATFSAMVAAVRYLSPYYSAFEIVCFRSIIGLVFAALYGWFLFGESSDALTWIGAAIIVAGTTYTTRHEVRATSENSP